MKTKEELNALKEEVKTVSKKLHELTDDELDKVVGGDEDCVFGKPCLCPKCGAPASAIYYFQTEEYSDISCEHGCYTMLWKW